MGEVARDMDSVIEVLSYGVEWSDEDNSKFIAFGELFKQAIQAELESAGGELELFGQGYLCFLGFFQRGDYKGQFSLSLPRVRGSGFPVHAVPTLMYRSAGTVDSGEFGKACFAHLEPGVGEKMMSVLVGD